jgi:hypothetical protein
MIPSMHNNFTKLFLSVAFLTVLNFGSNAQSTFSFGAKAGANIFKLSGNSFDKKFAVGFNAGGYAELNLNSSWGLQPEVLFSQASATTSESFNQQYQGVSFQRTSLDYISVPILIAFRPAKEFTILAGPQVGYLLYQTQNVVQYKTDAFKKADISIAFGGQFNLGKVKLGARYVIELNNINGLDNADNWQNQGFQFYFGYRLWK